MGVQVRWWQGTIAAAAVIVTAAAVSTNGEPADGTMRIVATNKATRDAVEFTVEGRDVGQLFPGRTRYMRLTLHNPYNWALKVTELRGEIAGTSRVRCKPTATNINVWAYTGSLPVTVPARSSKTVNSLPVSMAANATPECSQTTFTIRLVGMARKVN